MIGYKKEFLKQRWVRVRCSVKNVTGKEYNNLIIMFLNIKFQRIDDFIVYILLKDFENLKKSLYTRTRPKH